jgi:endonuclease V-like protein UPF0215 family
MDRESLGINGEHTALGNQIKEAEFRGYVIASLKNNEEAHNRICEEIQSLREDLREHTKSEDKRLESIETRVGSLEGFKNQAIGYVIALGAGVSIAVDVLMKIIFK